jgi:hypothetical protein
MGAVRNVGTFTYVLAPNDDGSSDLVDIGFIVNFSGILYEQLFVNNNGNVTFDTILGEYTPFNLLTTEIPIIAPFFGDVDTRGFGSDIVKFGQTVVSGRVAFVVNWVDVGYYNSAVDKLNSFQLILYDRSDISIGDFDIEFNYDQIEWEVGCASYEYSYAGCPGVADNSGNPAYTARAGWSNGVDFYYELYGSGINGAFLDGGIAALADGSANSGIPGRYYYPVRSGEVLNIFWEEKQKAIKYDFTYEAVE